MEKKPMSQGARKNGHYGMKVCSLKQGISLVEEDLEYLCALIERPDPEFGITDAVAIATAITALAHQLDFMSHDISKNPLSEDGEFVKLSKEEVLMLTDLSEEAEDAVQRLEEVCKISLKNN